MWINVPSLAALWRADFRVLLGGDSGDGPERFGAKNFLQNFLHLYGFFSSDWTGLKISMHWRGYRDDDSVFSTSHSYLDEVQ